MHLLMWVGLSVPKSALQREEGASTCHNTDLGTRAQVRLEASEVVQVEEVEVVHVVEVVEHLTGMASTRSPLERVGTMDCPCSR